MLKSKQFVSLCTAALLFFSAIPYAAAQESGADRQMEDCITLPEGTIIPIVLAAYLNTKSSQVGDIVYATTIYPIWEQQRLIIPKGSEIRGTLTGVERPGRAKGKGQLVIRFDDILLPNGVRRDLTATLRGIHGPGDETLDRSSESVEGGGSSGGDDAGTIVGTTLTGLSIGSIIGATSGRTGKGMAIGTGAGAAAGVVQVLLSRGKDLVLEPGTQFDLELLKALEFSYYEIQFSDRELSDAQRSVRNASQKRPSDASDRGRGSSWPRPGFGLPIPF